MRESEIESDVTDFAESLGWFQDKIMKTSRNSFPDRIFAKKGKVIFIEFKATGQVASPKQAKRHEEMREHGLTVYVVDNIEDGCAIINRHN